MYYRALSIFSSRSFSISRLKLRSLIPLECNLCSGQQKQVNLYFSVCGHSLFPLVFVKDAVSYPMLDFDFFIKSKMTEAMCFKISSANGINSVLFTSESHRIFREGKRQLHSSPKYRKNNL